MSLGGFLPLQFFGRVCKGLVFFFRHLVDFSSETIWAWVSLCESFFFFITNSFYLLIIGLFRLSISSWVSFGSLCLFRNLSIFPVLSILLAYNSSYYSLIILFISVSSVVMSSLSLLIWVIWVFLFFLLFSPAKSLSILLIFSKNQLLVSWSFAY